MACISSWEPVYTSLPNSMFCNIMWMAWNQAWWEYLHHRNWQTLQPGLFFLTGRASLPVYHLLYYRCLIAKALIFTVSAYFQMTIVTFWQRTHQIWSPQYSLAFVHVWSFISCHPFCMLTFLQTRRHAFIPLKTPCSFPTQFSPSCNPPAPR